MFWLARYRPQTLELVDTVLPIASLFQYYLCGAKKAKATFMAVQQLTSVGTADYNPRLLKAAGIPRRILPSVVVPGTMVGRIGEATEIQQRFLPQLVPPGTEVGWIRKELAEQTGLRDCKVIAVKTHDTASAYTAAPVDDRQTSLIVSSGTWSLVGKLMDKPLVNETVYQNRLANEGVNGNVRLLRNVMGTWPIQRLKDAWSKADGCELSWDEIVCLAKAAKPLATVVDVDDQALYNPPDMEEALRRQIRQSGQSQPADRGDLLRAVYEGLAIKIGQINRLLEQATSGQAPRRARRRRRGAQRLAEPVYRRRHRPDRGSWAVRGHQYRQPSGPGCGLRRGAVHRGGPLDGLPRPAHATV